MYAAHQRLLTEYPGCLEPCESRASVSPLSSMPSTDLTSILNSNALFKCVCFIAMALAPLELSLVRLIPERDGATLGISTVVTACNHTKMHRNHLHGSCALLSTLDSGQQGKEKTVSSIRASGSPSHGSQTHSTRTGGPSLMHSPSSPIPSLSSLTDP